MRCKQPRKIDGYNIVVRPQFLKLLERCLVRSLRTADVQRAVQAQHVAAVDRRRRLNVHERSIVLKHRSDAPCLSLSGLGARSGDDRDLVEHDRGIFDEDRVRELGRSRDADDRAAVPRQRVLVLIVLCRRTRSVDGLTLDERQLTIADGRTDRTGDGNAHGERSEGPGREVRLPELGQLSLEILQRLLERGAAKRRLRSGQLALDPPARQLQAVALPLALQILPRHPAGRCLALVLPVLHLRLD